METSDGEKRSQSECVDHTLTMYFVTITKIKRRAQQSEKLALKDGKSAWSLFGHGYEQAAKQFLEMRKSILTVFYHRRCMSKLNTIMNV